MILRLALAFSLVATPVMATEWRLKEGDRPLNAAELEALAGRTLTFYDDGRSTYSAGGSFSYTYSLANGGGTAFGTYHIAEDGSICTRFRNGLGRCDLYVLNGTRMLLITEKGERYPVRPE
ncbi:META domain-containing protein [Ruegeria sp. WL0004]|uniref:META domain-containing protein n=1 Tax=Ruegeria marisflavi TaxID=2984152 RepID=A0ABT2WRW6_9RHOB|nr:META domain-containing protein [Ruegeria sp. WL0004]MCU9838654.1 META domain-containing protein [Ruegeria sp. WL0004]